MPNHITNKVTIVGDPTSVSKFVAKAVGTNPRPPKEAYENQDATMQENKFCFNNFSPLPAAYETTRYSEGGQKMEIAAWGTKWGPYNEFDPVVGTGIVTYKFDTAWSPASRICLLIAQNTEWKDLQVILSWGGEGPSRGRQSFINGSSCAHSSTTERYEDVYPSYDEEKSASEENYEEEWEKETTRIQDHYLNTHEEWVKENFTLVG